jgi:hypothetical protein
MLVIFCAAAFLLGPPGTDSDINASRPGAAVEPGTADRLARTLAHQRNALAAVSLVYTQVPRSRKGEPEGAYLRRAIAVNGTGMFKSDNSHGHKRLPWHVDPTRKSLVVTQSKATLLENLNRCMVDFDLGDSEIGEAPESIQSEIIFDVLCWWPFSHWSPPQIYGHAYSMQALLDEGSYRLLPKKETLGSKPCYVLVVDDILTVWCDCDQPECVLKSERFNPRTQAIDSRIEMMEYEEADDNIWLPKRFRLVRFDSYAHTPMLREKAVYDGTFLVSDIKVNGGVDGSAFRQAFEPGTVRVVGPPGEIRYEPFLDGQLDHFNSILKWCRFGSLQTTSKQISRWAGCLLVFVFSFVVGCGVVAAIARAHSLK